MKVSEYKLTTVYTVTSDTLLVDAMQKMAHYRVNSLPVIDPDKHLTGIVLLDDVLAEFMPDFVDMIRSADFIHDYSFYTPRDYPKTVNTLLVTDMMREPYYITEESDLMSGLVMMHKHQVDELPVLDTDKRLSGLITRTRLGAVFVHDWLSQQTQKDSDSE